MSTNQIRSQRKPILPPTYLLVGLIMMLGLHFVYPVNKFIPIPWNLVGLLMLGFGVWISYAAEAQFHRAKTTVKPFDKPTILVTDGMFRFSRNPMYLGFVGILLGVAMMLGSLSPFLVIPLFVALIDLKFVLVEERNMAEAFGQDWLDYVQKVRRWL